MTYKSALPSREHHKDSAPLMKRWFLLTVVFLIALTVVVAITFPAAVAWRWWGAQAPDIGLQGINGTLWSGEAGRFSVRGQQLGRLTWTISPWRLWKRELTARLAVDGPGVKLAGTIRKLDDGSTAITELDGEAQGSWLGPALAIPVLEPTGRLGVVDGSLRLDKNGLPRDVDLTMVWHEAGVRGQVVARFGTITIVARGNDGRIGMTIEDAGDGELEVRGKVDLDQRNYRSEIVLAPRTTEGPVVEALKWIGAARPEGGRLLLIEGQILIPEKRQ